MEISIVDQQEQLMDCIQNEDEEIREVSSDIPREMNPKLYPFLKWVGGKTKYVSDIISIFPKIYNRYYEPFIGGGAIFFHIQPKRAYISDVNVELINCYQVIRSDVVNLMKELDKYSNKNTSENYYEFRNSYNSLKQTHKYSYDDVDTEEAKKICVTKAVLFIFLNKTCFRGLYRENKSGGMNVPFGNYTNPSLYDKENLININKYLSTNDVIIRHHSYEQIIPNREDLVYLDPPYDQEKKTDFVSYTKDVFKQEELFKFVEKLPTFVLSNAPTEKIKNLYKDYPQKILCGKRNVDVKKIKTLKDIEIIIWSNL